MILDNKFASEDELKDTEKKIKTEIDNEVEKIKNDPEPTAEDLYKHIGVTHHPIRGVEYRLSKWD